MRQKESSTMWINTFSRVWYLILAIPVAILASSSASAAQAGPGYDIEMSRMIPVRDGTSLEAWITKPSNVTAIPPATMPVVAMHSSKPMYAAAANPAASRATAWAPKSDATVMTWSNGLPHNLGATDGS